MKTPYEIKIGLIHCHREKCKGCPYYQECMLADAHTDLHADALEYIQQLENHIGELTEKVAQLEAAQPMWISVKDGLPQKSGKYIVCTVKGSVYCTSAVMRGDEACFKCDINTHITHWMPLPESPKEEE